MPCTKVEAQHSSPHMHQRAAKQARVVAVPCKYRAGRVLGHGTYATVKEMIHIETGERYAAKIINKGFMRGREQAIPNEISILKKLSRKHPNILTLHDYFETPHNMYLVTDLCVGGELFERICNELAFTEQDASRIIRQIVEGVAYLHENGVVHRDLKTENCLFRTKDKHSDVVIADFGLSQIVGTDCSYELRTHCGTPGYMAPEMVQRMGHGRPVDMWAVGVIAYFLLSGTTPFERESQKDELKAIVNCEFSFEPVNYWCNISPAAQHFIASLLVYSPEKRLTAKQALGHPWLAGCQRIVMPPVSPSLPRVFQPVFEPAAAEHGVPKPAPNDSGYANHSSGGPAASGRALPPATPNLNASLPQFQGGSSPPPAKGELRPMAPAIPQLRVEETAVQPPLDGDLPIGIGISLGAPIVKTRTIRGGEEVVIGSRNLIPGIRLERYAMGGAGDATKNLAAGSPGVAGLVDERTSQMEVNVICTPASSYCSSTLSNASTASGDAYKK